MAPMAMQNVSAADSRPNWPGVMPMVCC